MAELWLSIRGIMPHSSEAQYPVPPASPPPLWASRWAARTLMTGAPVPPHPHPWVHTVSQHHPASLSPLRKWGPRDQSCALESPPDQRACSDRDRFLGGGMTSMQTFSFRAWKLWRIYDVFSNTNKPGQIVYMLSGFIRQEGNLKQRGCGFRVFFYVNWDQVLLCWVKRHNGG